ncbi:MAG: hypothetical protein IT287_07550 [Bdellovibrionaceae bacterium]|nr:hypothetical protein [Pseudobdellovibrionaceae bacterium]
MNKTILFSIGLFALTACSSSPRGDNHKINCDKMHLDSQAKLAELQQIFNAYQNINVDLATKLSEPYKQEVAILDSRISKQKQRCWKDEDRVVDTDMKELKDDVMKIYGTDNDMIAKPTKKRVTRSMASAATVTKPVVIEPTEKPVTLDLPPPEPVPMGKADSDETVIPDSIEE